MEDEGWFLKEKMKDDDMQLSDNLTTVISRPILEEFRFGSSDLIRERIYIVSNRGRRMVQMKN